MVEIEDIKNLREATGAGIADCKEALDITHGNIEKAKTFLRQKGFDKAAQKSERVVTAGFVEVYSHGGRVGVVMELLCETDFVAKTDDFKNLAHELVLQIASMKPESAEELLKQKYARDESQTIDDLIKSVIGKVGENIKVGKFNRIELGK